MPDWVPGVIAFVLFAAVLQIPPVKRFVDYYLAVKRSDDYYADKRYW